MSKTLKTTALAALATASMTGAVASGAAAAAPARVVVDASCRDGLLYCGRCIVPERIAAFALCAFVDWVQG